MNQKSARVASARVRVTAVLVLLGSTIGRVRDDRAFAVPTPRVVPQNASLIAHRMPSSRGLVYNLEIEGSCTYAVTREKAWAHNSSTIMPAPPSISQASLLRVYEMVTQGGSDEICGLVYKDGTVRKCANVHDDPGKHFDMTEEDRWRIFLSYVQGEPNPVVIIWHTHPEEANLLFGRADGLHWGVHDQVGAIDSRFATVDSKTGAIKPKPGETPNPVFPGAAQMVIERRRNGEPGGAIILKWNADAGEHGDYLIVDEYDGKAQRVYPPRQR